GGLASIARRQRDRPGSACGLAGFGLRTSGFGQRGARGARGSGRGSGSGSGSRRGSRRGSASGSGLGGGRANLPGAWAPEPEAAGPEGPRRRAPAPRSALTRDRRAHGALELLAGLGAFDLRFVDPERRETMALRGFEGVLIRL